MNSNVFQTDNNRHEKRTIIYKNVSSICLVIFLLLFLFLHIQYSTSLGIYSKNYLEDLYSSFMFKYYYEFASTFKFIQISINFPSFFFSLIKLRLVFVMCIALILSSALSDSKLYCKIIRYVVIGIYFITYILYLFLRPLFIDTINVFLQSSLASSKLYTIKSLIIQITSNFLIYDFLFIFIILLTSRALTVFKILFPVIILLPFHTYFMTFFMNDSIAIPMDLFLYPVFNFLFKNQIFWLSLEILYGLILLFIINSIVIYYFIYWIKHNQKLFKLFTFPYPIFMILSNFIIFLCYLHYFIINVIDLLNIF